MAFAGIGDAIGGALGGIGKGIEHDIPLPGEGSLGGSGDGIGFGDTGSLGGSSGDEGSIGPSINFGESSMHTTMGDEGSDEIIEIPRGQPFAGRSAGGGTRDEVFGTS
jgi:hypothetical protein